MEKINRKLFVLLAAVALLALGCPTPSSNPAGAPTISGTVRDSATGGPIPGATVVVGADSALTGADGTFNFTYTSPTALTTDVFVYKGTDYQFWGTTNVQINVSANPAYNFYLVPNNTSVYPTITVSGSLPVAAGANPRLQLIIENSAGGIGGYYDYSLSSGNTGYSVTTATFGADCIVFVLYYANYTDPLQVPDVCQYYTGKNLSLSTTLNITGLPTTTVTVNGTAGDLFLASLDWSPCDIPNYVPLGTLSDTSTVVNVYDGENLPLVWTTAASNSDTPAAGYQTVRYNFGPSVPFAASVTLPAPASGVAAPSAVVDQGSVSWDSGTRTIAFTPAAGATLHVVQLTDNSGRQGRFLVNAPSGTVVLPADFVTNVLGGGTGWDSQIMPIASDRSLDTFIDLRIGGNGPANITDFQLAMVMSTAGLDVKTDLIP
jgi:hypothetical protein